MLYTNLFYYLNVIFGGCSYLGRLSICLLSRKFICFRLQAQLFEKEKKNGSSPLFSKRIFNIQAGRRK